MKFFTTSILCFLFAFNSLFSQKFDWSTYLDKKKGMRITRIIGTVGDYTCVELTHQPYSINGIKAPNTNSLAYYDKNNKLVKRVGIGFEQNDKKLDYRYTMYLKGKLYAFASFMNDKLKKKFLFVYEIDKESLEQVGEPRMIAETTFGERKFKVIVGYTMPEGMLMAGTSPDSSYFGIVATEHLEDDKPLTYRLKVFDNELSLVWEREVTKSAPEGKQLMVTKFELDNRGNIYTLMQESTPKKSKSKKERKAEKENPEKKPDYRYYVKAYRFQGVEVEDYELKHEDNFLTNVNFTLNDKNDLIISSFYNPKSFRDGITGIYYKTIDGISSEVKFEGHGDFSREFINKEVRKQKYEVDDLGRPTISAIIPLENDEFIIMAEDINRSHSASADNSALRYYYRDIYFWKLSTDKGIVVEKRIDKLQEYTVASGGSAAMTRVTYEMDGAGRVMGGHGSFVWAKTENAIKILYTEFTWQKNNFRKSDFGIKGKNVWTFMSIDFDGEMETEILTKYIPTETKLIPGSCKQMNSNTLFLVSSLPKKYQLGTLTFP